MTENGETEMMDNNEDEKDVKFKVEPMDEDVERSEEYTKLVDYGIDGKVAAELDIIFKSGLLCHGDLDERALDALKEFPADGGVAVLKEFKDSNLEHVSNKSAYLCGVMKTYRQKTKMQVGSETGAGPKKPGPDETKLKEILDRTGYSLDVTTGQRKYGGPPPDSDGSQPGAGHEIFVGKIPKDLFEDELIPLFEKCGTIWDLRLMMDPMTGLNRGYCFVTFTTKDGAREAVKLDNHEIKPSKRLKANISVANLRLFVGNIPKSKTKDDIVEEFSKLTERLQEVIIYSSPDDPKKKNRGFAFLEYSSHKDASIAKRRIGNGRTRVWGCDIIVDWADPQEEPDDDTMNKVKVLYVRNLKADVTEEEMKEKFEPYGKIERVKKIKDYGFVHFEDRDSAVKALDALNGAELGGTNLEISLAKPPSENKQKQKRQRENQHRIMGRGGYDDYWVPPPGRVPPPPGRGMRRSGPPRNYDYDYSYRGYGDDYYGYGDDYYGYDDGYYYDDYYSGYAPGPRGRGRAHPPPPPGRGRGIPPRGGRGGAMPLARGARGARGAQGRGAAGRGARGMAAGRGGQQRGGKRKAGGDHYQSQAKKRNTQSDNWGAQPIAQQPLNDQQWYQDSYGQQWG